MPHSAMSGRSTSGDHSTTMTEERSPSTDGKRMTKEDFKRWLKSIDGDGDGKITWHELRDALKGLGMNCTRWKAWRAMAHADLNGSKSIDVECDAEVEELAKYAAKRWSIVVT